jgi:uncharacterized protein YjiS (DUF1127 family)
MTGHAIVPTRPLLRSATPRRAIADMRWLKDTWAAVGRTMTLWRQRARSRAELDLIPDHRLNDLPFDTSVVKAERHKPFWKE